MNYQEEIAMERAMDRQNESRREQDDYNNRREEQMARKAHGLSYIDSNGTMYNADGKRSIFDDVDQ